MAVPAPFNPSYGSGQSIGAGASGTINKEHIQVCVTNLGAAVGYIRIGVGATTATAVTDYPVPPGVQVVITKSAEQDTAAVAGSALHVMTGTGF